MNLNRMNGAGATEEHAQLTAELLLAEERDRLLKKAANQAYVDDFNSVRDENGVYRGHAAAFASYEEPADKGTRL